MSTGARVVVLAGTTFAAAAEKDGAGVAYCRGTPDDGLDHAYISTIALELPSLQKNAKNQQQGEVPGTLHAGIAGSETAP